MDLDPSDEQQSIVDVFGGLAERTVPLDRLRDHEPVGFAPALWEQLVAVGAPGMAVPEDAGGAGATLLDLALSWHTSHPLVASVIAGATQPEQVAANVAASTWELTDADRAEVDAVLAG